MGSILSVFPPRDSSNGLSIARRIQQRVKVPGQDELFVGSSILHHKALKLEEEMEELVLVVACTGSVD